MHKSRILSLCSWIKNNKCDSAKTSHYEYLYASAQDLGHHPLFGRQAASPTECGIPYARSNYRRGHGRGSSVPELHAMQAYGYNRQSEKYPNLAS